MITTSSIEYGSLLLTAATSALGLPLRFRVPTFWIEMQSVPFAPSSATVLQCPQQTTSLPKGRPVMEYKEDEATDVIHAALLASDVCQWHPSSTLSKTRP